MRTIINCRVCGGMGDVRLMDDKGWCIICQRTMLGVLIDARREEGKSNDFTTLAAGIAGAALTIFDEIKYA